ncbi:MAG: SpoIIE family protein phosphatase, partial [Deltaproteobacteria bacterium]|nr:SpoIIE family protein phosphatase [Deltaproteobacteria bacterium]
MDTKPRGSIDIKYKQLMKYRERVFGDTFQYHHIREEERLIIILSDGLGSGIKANVLSTLTATMAMNFTSGLRDVNRCAQIIMKTLPVCSVRKISYATFTIVEIDREHNLRVINYDNPLPILIKNNRCEKLPVEYSEGVHRERKYRLEFMHCRLEQNDRMILLSDGITQAGMGSKRYPLGWGYKGVTLFTQNLIETGALPGARELAEAIIS